MTTKRKRAEVMENTMQDFALWWHEEGSAMRPLPGEDQEQHVLRVSQIAWSNGAYCDDKRLRNTIKEMTGSEPIEISISWHWFAVTFAAIGWLVWWLI